ncbi:MAG: septum formation initiator family protein [Proteobacteria bacterium]|jgi:cell division protein FtsB|nr:septum formation initiator family protein [Pseudomonadota bacterium]
MLEDVIKKYGLIILLSALFFQMVFSEGGVFGYIKMKREIKTINATVKKIEQDNILLMKEIDKLQQDDQYLEEVVRKKFGFVREGEKLYRIER